MKSRISFAMVAGLLFVGAALHAQAPAGAPAGTTGKCKDGTYTSAANKQGACRGHQGVDTWYASASASTAAPAPKTTTAPTKSAAAPAAAPASGAMPAGATGKCKDGTFTTQATKQGACRGHQGVDTWYAATPAAAPAAAPAAKQTAPPPQTRTVETPAPAAAAPPTSRPSPPTRTSSSDKPAAPGGAPGLVWVNSDSNVYHCYGTQWYGKTKAGKYESETAAKAAGARPERGKPCGQ